MKTSELKRNLSIYTVALTNYLLDMPALAIDTIRIYGITPEQAGHGIAERLRATLASRFGRRLSRIDIALAQRVLARYDEAHPPKLS